MKQIKPFAPFSSNTLKESPFPILIWGKSTGALNMYQQCASFGIAHKVIGFTDSFCTNPSNELFCGLRIFSHEEIISSNKPYNIVLGTKSLINIENIMSTLIALGIHDNIYVDTPYESFPLPRYHAHTTLDNQVKIKTVYNCLCDSLSKKTFEIIMEYRYTGKTSSSKIAEITSNLGEEYYPPFLQLTQQETFIDCGAFDGDTIFQFLKQTNYKYKSIIGFEPDHINFEIGQQRLKLNKIQNCKFYCHGVYDHNSTIAFNNLHNWGSSINTSGNDTITTIYLDDILCNENDITYIKMDIEGAELKALHGSIQTIKKHSPKLAICNYHLESDLWEIPYFIINNFPNYSIYIRHYLSENLRGDTICYAIPT